MAAELDEEAIGSLLPVFVARAIIEAGGDLIRRAWAYLAAWSALERAGVPALLRRELLDPKLAPTETLALQRVRAWAAARPRSAFAVIGDVGLGKSYAGADWLLAQYRLGRGIRWVSCAAWTKLPLERDSKREEDRDLTTLADEERKALQAAAVVIDDFGAGWLSPFMRERINTLLVQRDAADRPTLILLNPSSTRLEGDDKRKASEDPLGLLDPRVLDRMRSGKGGHTKLPKSKSLRAESREDEVDELGRGKAWRAAVGIIELVGCKDTRHDGAAWNREQREPILEPEFGWRLERVIAGADWLGEAERARGALRCDARDVERIANALAEQDQAFERLGLLPSLVQRLSEPQERQRGEPTRVGKTQSVAQVIGRRPEPIRDDAPALPEGERLRLAALGGSVCYSDALGEWEARFQRKRLQGERRPKGQSERERKHGRSLGTATTERGAWQIVREWLSLETAERHAAAVQRSVDLGLDVDRPQSTTIMELERLIAERARA